MAATRSLARASFVSNLICKLCAQYVRLQDYYFPASLNISGVSDATQFNYTSAVIHHVHITKLKAKKQYYYTLGA